MRISAALSTDAEEPILRDTRFYLGCLGLALAMASQTAYLSFLTSSADVVSNTALSVASLWGMLPSIVLLPVVMLIWRKPRRLRMPRFTIFAAAAVIALGTLVALLHPAVAGLSVTTARDLAGILVGIGGIVLTVCWLDLLADLGGKALLMCSAIATLLTVLILIVTSSLGTLPGQITVVAIPLVSAALLLTGRKGGDEETGAATADAEPASDVEHGMKANRFLSGTPLWETCLTISLYAIVLGVTKGSWMRTLDQTDLVLSIATRFSMLLGQGLGALLILAGVMFSKGSDLPERHLLPLVMISLYLSTFLTGASSLVYTVLNSASTTLVMFLIWVALASSELRGRHSIIYIYAVASFWFAVSDLFAIWMGALWTQALAMVIVRGLVVSVAVVLLLLLESRHRFALGTAAPDESATEHPPKAIDFAEGDLPCRCEHLAEDYHLTSRELDILQLLARGRTAPYIASAYTLGRQTAKTHIHNIYQKTGVHSQQDLIDLVERECGEQQSESESE